MAPRRRLLLPALLAACGALAGEARAAAAAATPTATALLDLSRAPDAADCPVADALAAMVNEGLGRVALVPASAGALPGRARVAVTFQRTVAARGFAATVRIGDGRGGTRTLSDGGPGCGALGNAVGVLLVLLLDSSAGATPGTGPAPPRATTATVATISTAPPATARRMTADVGVGAGAAEGLVGGWSPAFALGGTLAYRRFAARLGGFWVPPASSDFGPGRVEVRLVAARIAACASLLGDRARLALGLCAQQQVGWLHARGLHYEASNRAADHLWLAAGMSIVAGGPLGPAFGWEAEAGAVRVLRQQRFVVTNLGTAFESDPFAFVATLGVTTRVW